MPTTTRLQLPYPSPDDNPDGPAQFKALAERLDAVVVTPITGDLKFSARTAAHGNWIVADGRVLAPGQYTALRDALIAEGSPYESSGGDPAIPDMRCVVPVGAGATTEVGGTPISHAHGEYGGHERHLLAGNESGLPDHNHNLDPINAGGAPPAGVSLGGGRTGVLGSTATGGSARALTPPMTNGQFNYALGVGGVTNGARNAPNPHNSMQPYAVGTWFIYAA